MRWDAMEAGILWGSGSGTERQNKQREGCILVLAFRRPTFCTARVRQKTRASARLSEALTHRVFRSRGLVDKGKLQDESIPYCVGLLVYA